MLCRSEGGALGGPGPKLAGRGAQAFKLKSPNFSISRTRLSVRNIPASMDEAGLKKLAIQAVSVYLQSRLSSHVPHSFM